MSNKESYDREQFEKAGQQAGQIFGRFMSVATEFANEFNNAKAEKSANPNTSADHKPGNDPGSEVLQEAGEHLRKMRETAGYTLDSFSAALEKEISRHNQEPVEVVSKVEAAEAGREPLPLDWLNQVSSLLSNGDPVRFFEKLQESYSEAGSGNSRAANSAMQNDANADVGRAEPLTGRVQKFSEIFQSDVELDQLTEAQFEMLLGFVENSYRDAKKLVSGK